MTMSFLELIAMLMWPLVMSAGAWAIANYALGEAEEISEVVDALTRPKGADESAKSRKHGWKWLLPAQARRR